MEYEGRLFGKVGKSYIPLTNTTADFKMLENRVRELEAENLKLRQSEHLHKHGVSVKQPDYKTVRAAANEYMESECNDECDEDYMKKYCQRDFIAGARWALSQVACATAKGEERKE